MPCRFILISSFLALRSQNDWTIFGNHKLVFVLAGKTAIKRFMCPTRFKVCINFPSSCVNHWLDGQDHSFFKAE